MAKQNGDKRQIVQARILYQDSAKWYNTPSNL